MIKIVIKSILAGFMIAIGGVVYLSCDNKIVGSVLFSIGLFVIVSYGLNLYTGKIGYLVSNPTLSYIKELGITLVGNFIGTFIVGFLVQFTRLNIMEKAIILVNIKINDSLISIFLLSIFCGMLMFIGVDLYKKLQYDVGKHLIIILAVVVFILSGFEHCVANMFYFALCGYVPIMFVYLLVMILGNSVGGCSVAYLFKLLNKSENVVSDL